jgi:hypothetical protein
LVFHNTTIAESMVRFAVYVIHYNHVVTEFSIAGVSRF